MDSKSIETGMTLSLNGTEVEVVSNARGWITVQTQDGTSSKVRAKALELLGAEGGYSMRKQLNKYRAGYKPSIAASGKPSLNNGDEVALALTGLDHIAVAALADALIPLEDETHMERYAKLNNGQIRMNSGNRIRSAAKKGLVTTKQNAAGLWTLKAA